MEPGEKEGRALVPAVYMVRPVLTIAFDHRQVEASSREEAQWIARSIAAEIFTKFVVESSHDLLDTDHRVCVYEFEPESRADGELLAIHEEPGIE